MIIFSGTAGAEDGFPDETPPGTGYLLTVAVITICAVLTVIMALRARQRPTMSPIMTTHSGTIA